MVSFVKKVVFSKCHRSLGHVLRLAAAANFFHCNFLNIMQYIQQYK